MPAPELLQLPILREPFESEVANGLEHPEPVLPLPDKALLDKGCDSVEVRAGDLFGCFEREAAYENAESRKEHLLRFVEQLVAPRDGVAEGALAVRDIAGASGQHGKPLVEPIEESFGGEDFRAGRRELDGQRKTVQPPADRRDRRPVPVQPEIRLDGLRALAEEGNGVRVGQLGNRVLVLDRDAQRRSAGEDRLHRRGIENEFADLRRRSEQMLEIVKHE